METRVRSHFRPHNGCRALSRATFGNDEVQEIVPVQGIENDLAHLIHCATSGEERISTGAASRTGTELVVGGFRYAGTVHTVTFPPEEGGGT